MSLWQQRQQRQQQCQQLQQLQLKQHFQKKSQGRQQRLTQTTVHTTKEATPDDQVGSRQEEENTKEVLFNFMEQELQIVNAREKLEFQRVHRLGKPKANESRPIIARLLRYQDREVKF